ncbi:WXG100 family type VII secretion target [Nocardia sp. CA2R105]|uniref:WXG100 family type VII secretion target n=1 Tax=Nocardia coffeae TaxID=2873381 RepID=UPI001CA67AE9|nr:WXG100 family type VII secretion target [Nocardia coffeae]MBY8860652.1 WXG100 family type VII secretion target [Nocardia coffeae]
MADRVGVQPADVHAAADWLTSSAREFSDDLTQLMRQVHGFIGSEWTGPAAGSHHDAWSDWARGAREVIAALEREAGALHSAANGFTTLDRHRADAIRTIDPEVT